MESRDVSMRLAAYGLAVHPRLRVWQLSVGEQQRVEILKALYREARVLILDEPTAVLTPQEAEKLFETLRAMAAEGRTVIFISHKLNEVKAVADRVTVLRRGRSIATVPAAEATGASGPIGPEPPAASVAPTVPAATARTYCSWRSCTIGTIGTK